MGSGKHFTYKLEQTDVLSQSSNAASEAQDKCDSAHNQHQPDRVKTMELGHLGQIQQDPLSEKIRSGQMCWDGSRRMLLSLWWTYGSCLHLRLGSLTFSLHAQNPIAMEAAPANCNTRRRQHLDRAGH